MATTTAPSRFRPEPTLTPIADRTIQRGLLLCGILSAVVYVATDLLGAMRWQGYSLYSQTISELMGIDAPSRPLVVPLFLFYDVLTIAFGVGVWRAAGGSRALRVASALWIAMGVVGLAGPFVPVHLRGVEPTLTDTMHIVVTSVLALVIMVAIGFGAAAFGGRFRLYSIATLVTMVVFGALTGMQAGRLAAWEPTPWLGITERFIVYGYLLWPAVLAVVMLRAERPLVRAGR